LVLFAQKKNRAKHKLSIYLDEHPDRFCQADKAVLYVAKYREEFNTKELQTAGEGKRSATEDF
jgi:hypothetical protein